MEIPTFTRTSLSNVRVIMVILRVPVDELVYQVGTERIQYSSAYCQVHVGACNYILSCLALNDVASQGSQLRWNLPSHLENLGHGQRGPGCVWSQVMRTGWTGGEILLAQGYRDGGMIGVGSFQV
jgi:hypothetical protein